MLLEPIDHIKTNTFSIGTFGRSGSRSIAEFLCGYYRDIVWSAIRMRYLYDFDNISEEEKVSIIKSYDNPKHKHMNTILMKPFSTNRGFLSMMHHWHSAEEISSFNNHNNFLNNIGPKILTLREPLERAKSGQEKNHYPKFHGAPVLESIDLETVDYILPFANLEQYVLNVHIGGSEDQPSEEMFVKWNLEDYNYEQETDLYNELLQTKEILPLDLWKNLVRNFTEINIPCSQPSLRYKKKWDM